MDGPQTARECTALRYSDLVVGVVVAGPVMELVVVVVVVVVAVVVVLRDN